MQQTKKIKMADAISPYLAVSCELRKLTMTSLLTDRWYEALIFCEPEQTIE